MISTSVKLYETTYITNDIGSQSKTFKAKEVPIMKIEDIYANEFYQADKQGYKPTLRLRLSSLNYNDEPFLEYRGKVYSVIRTQYPVADEVILICEKKLNVDEWRVIQ